MKHLMQIIQEDQLLKVLIALLMGAILGLEREYKRKAAGMRTMTLICVSCTVFTILSAEMGYPASADRIASNILTGVGFIGAGVIFKGDYAIDGITTAATIWVAAAIGMAVGMSQYLLAGSTLVAGIVVLIGMEYLEFRVAIINDKKLYTIFYYEEKFPQDDLETVLQQYKLKYKRMLIMRKEDIIEVNYAVRGHRDQLRQLDSYLLQNKNIFEYKVQTNPI
ncbi:MgtC/SapB family protein [Chitinophaga nivalis]|uniref:MgtC/SapB family protein n=1 Tax=Chitinophaga nivalis TaxID=2991709 RepID=A0ABT3IL86_9BACT|nr:MgtC/SapB family protein [Chitinophaga nivalis]MCW3465638.1 MgtC/SapB family protein [Chitinophaga nivalis]MCW3484671.1 MgtC/SapB family protein [Chitinophaga nivalis]